MSQVLNLLWTLEAPMLSWVLSPWALRLTLDQVPSGGVWVTE